MMGFLKSAAGVLAVLLCAASLAAGVWFWMGKDVRAKTPEGTLVLKEETSVEAFAAPADVLIPVFTGGEVHS